MPGDGYQVVNPHDWREGPQRYRVQPRRAPSQAPSAPRNAQAELRRQVNELALTGITILFALAGFGMAVVAGYLYLYPRRRRQP